jgi:hypothetical protein
MIQDITTNAIGGLVTSVIVGAFVLGLRSYIRWRDQFVARGELLHEIKNKTHRPTPLMLLYTLAVLQLAWTLAIFGVTALLVQYFGREDDNWASIVLSTLLVMGIAVIPIAIRLYHRLHKNYFWIKPLVIILTFFGTVTEVSLITREYPGFAPDDLLGLTMLLAMTFVALLPGMYLGQYIARKTQSAFTIVQLFKHLSPSDKKELIELVDSLPSVSTKEAQ